MRRLILLVVCLLCLPVLLAAQEGVFNPRPVFDRSDFLMHVSLNGQIGHSPSDGDHGMYWPGSGPTEARFRGLGYTSTPVLVGRVNCALRVSASYYRDAFLNGPVFGGRPVVDPTDPVFRAYTVSYDETEETDYREWDMAIGAPRTPANEPLFYGPSQMYWLMNDLDTAAARGFNGCDPMGLEMRCLLYAPWTGDARDNTLLLQVTYINRGQERIRDAYAGYFMDVELREPLNDLPGSDSALGMVYAYQGNIDAADEGMPAAFGIAMLQTPAVPAAGDSARWFEGWKADARNIPVTAAVAPLKGSWGAGDPIKEPALGADATERWSALIQGRGSGVDVINPRTGAPSRFWYSGNPATGEGWLPKDGIRLSDGQNIPMPASDQRLLISAGPFDLAPGDTQQVTYAFIASRGATPAAAVQDLLDRAAFLKADFAGGPLARAYRSATVRPTTASSVPGQIEVNARLAGLPADLRVEVRSAGGAILANEALDRFASGTDYVYRKTVPLPSFGAEGVNVSFTAEAAGERMRIPGRVSQPVAGSVDMQGIEILEEGDDNGRIAPEDDAKWFPRFVNGTGSAYEVHAQSFVMPSSQWLHLPSLSAGGIVPSQQSPWEASFGYATLWADSLITGADSIAWRYDLFDPGRNVWWERQNWVPVDSAAEEWYDVLMTQVRGVSDERPGVRLVDLDALQDRWYVLTVSGDHYDRRLALHDSSSGVPYFEDYGLDIFRGASPSVDGFRVVRGTIARPYESANPVTGADLFVFNPRHVLLARSLKPAAAAVVSRPSPTPFRDWTSVHVELPEAGAPPAEVYNLVGQRVEVLRDETVAAARHLRVWDGYWKDGRPAESGMYLLRVIAGGGEVTRKIIVLR